MPPMILAIDPSLTSTGVCTGLSRFTIEPKGQGDARLVEIRDTIRRYTMIADYAVLEDLPTHAHSAGILGMVQGLIRCELQSEGVPYATIPPATLKYFATRDGRANKVQMADALEKRTGILDRQPDRVDAAWLHIAGAYLFDPDQAVPMPPSYVEALSKAKMPPNWKNPIAPPDKGTPRRRAPSTRTAPRTTDDSPPPRSSRSASTPTAAPSTPTSPATTT